MLFLFTRRTLALLVACGWFVGHWEARSEEGIEHPVATEKPEGMPTPPPIDQKPEGDDAVRLQIFLDQKNYEPGVIDGKVGRFTALAAASWNEFHGHPPDDWTAVNTAARKAIKDPFTVATIPEVATEWVNSSLSYKYSQQAKAKRMSYRSVVEFMSERYHSDIPYLTKLNDSKKVWSLTPGDTLIVPNVTPFLIEKITGVQYRTPKKQTTDNTEESEGNHLDEHSKALSSRHVVVNTKINQVRIFEAAPPALVIAEPGALEVPENIIANKSLIASFPITPGKPRFIKFGTWELRNMIELPYWRYDRQLLNTGRRSKYALNIPAGPNSPVGIIWNGLSKPGIGLHGTSNPETIGRTRSAGCIRLANWDAIKLPSLIRPGATVEVR